MGLVLASASPRRWELLRNAGIEFRVEPTQISEILRPGEEAKNFSERLAREKALAVFRQTPQGCVLGADTVVVRDGEILGKPQDEADALRMLRLLSGRTHEVITGVCLVGTIPVGRAKPASATQGDERFEDIRSQTTLVAMAEISDQEMEDYIASGEPMDKAGAYAVQGQASRWIRWIQGDYFNVVGLPVALVWRMLREHQLV
jgi:septum formation protein